MPEKETDVYVPPNSGPESTLISNDAPPGTVSDTVIAKATAVQASAANCEACLVNIYPRGPGMGLRYSLSNNSMFVGRDEKCDVRIDNQAVSRRHAEIRPGVAGHYVIDLNSTNGTYVNEKPVTVHKFKDGDNLRIGNWVFRYLAGGNVEAEYHEEIYRLTILDGLTGIHNKRSLLEYLERELARTARHHRPLSLILFDIDFFKAINDGLGHLAGDYTLCELSARVSGIIRREELFARYGGEEFVVVCLETPLEGAVQMADRLRNLIEARPFTHSGRQFTVTISLGVITTTGEPQLTAEELIHLADEKLYEAKNTGRNRVVY